jgi:hypothetical protein
MNSHLAVNQVLDRLAAYEEQPMQVEGVLEVHEEGYALKHYPNAERRTEYVEEGYSYQSGIWIEFGDGSVRPNARVLDRWQGKRVRVYGVIHGISSLPSTRAFSKGGFGPWGLWPAAIEPTSIQRVTAEERREGGA